MSDSIVFIEREAGRSSFGRCAALREPWLRTFLAGFIGSANELSPAAGRSALAGDRKRPDCFVKAFRGLCSLGIAGVPAPRLLAEFHGQDHPGFGFSTARAARFQVLLVTSAAPKIGPTVHHGRCAPGAGHVFEGTMARERAPGLRARRLLALPLVVLGLGFLRVP